MKKLAIAVTPETKPLLAYDKAGFAGLGLATCCVGLAWNRERIIESNESRDGNFCADCMLYMLCWGFCLTMRDEMFTFPIRPKPEKVFDEKWHVCFDFKQLKDKRKCLSFLSVICCPLPFVCLLQAYTVYKLEAMKKQIEGRALREKKEKRNEFFKPLIKNCAFCCFGFALNRTRIAEIIGVDEHLALDCLKYCIGGCPCLVLQEYYTLITKQNKMANILKEAAVDVTTEPLIEEKSIA